MSAPPPKDVSTVEQSRWFTDEVYAHEPSLRSYLHGAFPSVRDVDDVVQESYVRIWKARLSRPIHSSKTFLFRVARHLAVDLLRRKQVSPISDSSDLAAVSVIEDRPNAADALTHHERIDLLSDALAALPERCRMVVYLRKFKGLSQKDTAAQLGVSVRTVESQFARGVKLCEDYLRQRGVESFKRGE